MKENLISHRQAIKKLLREEELDEIKAKAQSCSKDKGGDLEFSAFQRTVLQKIFRGFTYQRCTTSTIVSGEDMTPIEISTVCLDLPEEVLINYMQFVQYDDLSPLVYKNPGRAISYAQLCLEENFEDHPFFVNHCKKFGIYRVISLGYRFPISQHTFTTFDYLGSENNKDWHYFDHTKLELASFPFALAWLYRQGRLDIGGLSSTFSLLEGLTESKLQNLRKFINSPQQSFEERGKSLGIDGSGLRADLNNTHKLVSRRLRGTENSGEPSNNKRLGELALHYDFLKMLEDHTKPLIGFQ